MKTFWQRNKYFLLLIILFLLAEIFVNPTGNFPLNDDWTYTQSLKVFYRELHINIGNFAAMTLFTQILWGYLFTKLFGFSFFVLRISTMVATLIGMAYLNKLILRITANKMLAFAGCTVLLFNPMIFNLTNTFMTDTNFNTLLIICCYYAYDFFSSRSVVSYTLFIVFAVLIVLLRQFGMVIPIAFFAACLFIKDRKRSALLMAGMAVVVVIASLKIYEAYLHRTMDYGAYKYSGDVNIGKSAFWEILFHNLERRHVLIMNFLIYSAPVAIMFAPSLLRQHSRRVIALLLLIDVIFVYWVFSTGIVDGNIFYGVEIGVQTMQAEYHVYSHIFDVLLAWMRWFSALTTLLVFFLRLATAYKNRRLISIEPMIVFFLAFIGLYTVMICMAESFFDRYHIPLITMSLFLVIYLCKDLRPVPALGILPFLFWFYIALTGTHDYMTWNTVRWKAYWYARKELHSPANKVNGGFEINNWREGNGVGWQDFFTSDNTDYMILFKACAPFTVPVKTYTYQRYLPYQEDKISIFVKQKKPVTYDQQSSKER